MNHTTALHLAFSMLSKEATGTPKELEKDPTEVEPPKAVKEQSMMDRLLGAKVPENLGDGEKKEAGTAVAKPAPTATPAPKVPLIKQLTGVTPAIADAAKEGPVTTTHPATK